VTEGAVESIYLLFYFFYDDLGEEELYIFISARLTFIGGNIEKLS
jgi:hypothetical protein